MYTKPNQKIVVNAEEPPKIDKNNRDAKKFVVSRIRGNEEAAMRDLNYGAFKLWLMFSADAKDFKRAFSPTQAEQDLGISQPTARSGLKELVEKGYLIQKEESNIYEFYQVPQKILDVEIEVERRRFTDKKGIVHELTLEEFLEGMRGSKFTEEQLKKQFDKYELV